MSVPSVITFKCRETGKFFESRDHKSESEAYEAANNFFRPYWSRMNVQFYSWFGGPTDYYAGYGVWD